MANQQNITVDPAYLDVTLNQLGQTEQVQISYKNNTEKPISLQIFAVDLKHQDNGFINLGQQDAGSFSYSLASFLSLESNRIDLEPGEQHNFTISITNREDISPGGHYAAVVARLQNSEKTADQQTQIAPSVSSMILLRKSGGERYNLSVKDIDWPRYSISFTYPRQITMQLQNEGNVHVIPYGEITVRDIFGRQIKKGNINDSSTYIFPETRRYYKVLMHDDRTSYPLSVNVLQVNGHDSLNKITYIWRETYIFVHPLILVGLVVVCIALIMSWRRKKTKKR